MDVKSILNETLLSSTAHGIPNILRAKSTLLKMIWSFFLTLSLIVCFYFLKKALTGYFDHEVVTKIVVTNEISSEFPSIKICHQNGHFISNYTNQTSDTVINYIDSDIKVLLPYCKFNSIDCDLANDFSVEYDIFYGYCLIFNNGKNFTGNSTPKKEMKRVGKDNGLILKLFIKNSYSAEKNNGLRILIFNSSSNSIINRICEGIDISTGLETNVILNRLFIYKKETPYSDCISEIEDFESDLLKLIINSGYAYRQNDCLDLCTWDLIFQSYNCSISGISPLNSLSPCNSSLTYYITSSIYNYNNIFIKSFENIKNVCLPKCPLECSSIQYNPVLYHGIGNKDIQNNKDNKLLLNMFYDTLSFTTVTEFPKTETIELILNVGGTLGLFIGISVLSFANKKLSNEQNIEGKN